MNQKQVNGEEIKLFFSASSVKLNLHLNFFALLEKQAFLRTKKNTSIDFFLVTSKKSQSI